MGASLHDSPRNALAPNGRDENGNSRGLAHPGVTWRVSEGALIPTRSAKHGESGKQQTANPASARDRIVGNGNVRP